MPEPAFYAYLYPAPEGYKNAMVEPKDAYFHKALGEFILPYKIVSEAVDPEAMLSTFLNSSYQAGATLAEWNRDILERYQQKSG